MPLRRSLRYLRPYSRVAAGGLRRAAGPPRAFGLLAVPVLALTACSADPWPDPPPVAAEALAAEHEDWRVYRQGRLVEPPGGAVIWIGLWELHEGEVQFGSDPSLPIALPEEDSPPVAGTLRRTGDEVTLEPAADAELRVRGEEGDALATGPLTLRNDRADDPTWLALGSLGLRVHAEMGTDRLWLRAWDEDSPKRETFRLPPFYPVEPAWRMAARMDPYAEPRAMPLADVTDGTVANGEGHRRGRPTPTGPATAGRCGNAVPGRAVAATLCVGRGLSSWHEPCVVSHTLHRITHVRSTRYSSVEPNDMLRPYVARRRCGLSRRLIPYPPPLL